MTDTVFVVEVRVVVPAAGGRVDSEGLEVPVNGLGGDTEDQGGAADVETSFADEFGDFLSGVRFHDSLLTHFHPPQSHSEQG